MNIIRETEEEDSFTDLSSLIHQVTGGMVDSGSSSLYPLPATDSGKGHMGDQQLQLNVTAKTNIVNIFAFNIYPGGKEGGEGGSPYHVQEFRPAGTTIHTGTDVHLKGTAGRPAAHIRSVYDYQSRPGMVPAAAVANQADKILGAVLLAQMERGGGSDRVIQALSQNPMMMAALMGSGGSSAGSMSDFQVPLGGPYGNSKDRVSSISSSPQVDGLYSLDNVDNLDEYAPGPYGLIARHSAMSKIISALDLDLSSPQGIKDLEAYMTILEEHPEYASAILAAGGNDGDNIRPQQRSEEVTTAASMGPLGFTYPSQDKKKGKKSSSSSSVGDSTDFLASLSENALPALMAGALVTSPYWLSLLAGKRRRKRFAYRYGRRDGEKIPDISPDWLALLTGQTYESYE